MTENDFRWTTALVNEYACKLVMSKPGTGYTIQDFIKEKQSQDKQVGWKIVEMTNGKGTWIREGGPNDKWDMFLSMEEYYINQVRRLSDGEVFTVGDKIKDNDGIISIEKFEIEHAFVNLLKICFNEGGFLQIDKCPVPLKPQPSSIDRIEVTSINFIQDTVNGGGQYYFQTNSQFHPDKFPAIKQAIEQAINSKEEADYVGSISKDKFWLSTLRDIKEVEVNNKKFIPQSEVDTIREETWKAARETTFSFKGEQDFPNPKIKYPTLQDYLNSLSKETKPKEQGKVLFTTDDGVEITKPDEVVYFYDDDWNLLWSNAIAPKIPNVKYFYHQASSDKYLLENKPSLSLNEVMEVVRKSSDKNFINTILLDKAKQKLKQ